jgi:hypothetical protein
MLIDIYKRLRHSIVAFCPKFAPDEKAANAAFPPIIGTGFVVHEDGLLATNDHVVSAFARLPRPEGYTEWPAVAVLFLLTERGMVNVHLDIGAVSRISQFSAPSVYYGPDKPDIALVHVKMRGLLPVNLRPHGKLYVEGEEVATAGFPMGTDQLMVPGWLHQMSPTLQTGIVSAVHPFPCSTPHGFTMNIMSQGGASGSPIFNKDDGEVLGALYAGVFDLEVGGDQTIKRIPTNYTYGVASHFIVNTLPKILARSEFKQVRDLSPTLRETFAQAAPVNMITGEKMPQLELPW